MKTTVLTVAAMIALNTIAQAQQTEGEREEAALSEVYCINAMLDEINQRMEQIDGTNARELLEICQTVLPKLDDAYRVWMMYARPEQKAELQRLYIKIRQGFIDDMVIAQRALQIHPSTPSPSEP